MPNTSAAPAELAQLREQVARLEGRPSLQAQQAEPIPTHPALSGLLQLRAGASYAVDNASLAIAMMAGPSAEGAWCAIIGSAELSLPAAAAAGVVLERTIVIPEPAGQWLDVIAAVIDAVQVVVLRPPEAVTEAAASRLSARLRARGGVLVAWGQWPRTQAQLSITDSAWQGVGQGNGHLRSRQATIAVRQGSAPARTARMWLPDEQRCIRSIDERADESAHERPLRSVG